ncbi:MAG: exosortase H-associated membrane protein [Candidatus Hydrogenedentota bacterium]
MAQEKRALGILFFCLKFIPAVAVCLTLWWLFLPYYGAFLGAVGEFLLENFTDVSVDGYAVEPDGILQTATTLAIITGGREMPIEIGHLVTNLPLFVALMLATGGLTWRRRGGMILLGAAILVVGHTTYLTLAFRYAGLISEAPQVPTALGEVFLTLPFLLWIILGYWPQVRQVFVGTSEEAPGEA